MVRLAILAVAVLSSGTALAGVACLQGSAELEGRKVNDVKIVTLLEFPFPTVNRLFFSTLDDRLARLKTALAIQKGQMFTEANHNAARLQIDGAISAAQRQRPQRIQIAVVLPA